MHPGYWLTQKALARKSSCFSGPIQRCRYGGHVMQENLQDILKNWGLEHIVPVPNTGAGAAIATGVWDLEDGCSLKTGSNFDGLRHHIHISKILKENGITASCPVPTLSGEDFFDAGDHYYVITTPVVLNFLSNQITCPAQDKEMFTYYGHEINNFDRALASGQPEFMQVLDWAAKQTCAAASKRNILFSPDLFEKSHYGMHTSLDTLHGFICATPFSMPLQKLLAALNTTQKLKALLFMLALFIAWTGEKTALEKVISGNLALAETLVGGVGMHK